MFGVMVLQGCSVETSDEPHERPRKTSHDDLPCETNSN